MWLAFVLLQWTSSDLVKKNCRPSDLVDNCNDSLTLIIIDGFLTFAADLLESEKPERFFSQPGNTNVVIMT